MPGPAIIQAWWGANANQPWCTEPRSVSLLRHDDPQVSPNIAWMATAARSPFHTDRSGYPRSGWESLDSSSPHILAAETMAGTLGVVAMDRLWRWPLLSSQV